MKRILFTLAALILTASASQAGPILTALRERVQARVGVPHHPQPACGQPACGGPVQQFAGV